MKKNWDGKASWDAEKIGADGTLGRQSYGEVLLVRHFKVALKVLNPWITEAQTEEAVERMTEHLSSQTLMQINEQKYSYIRDGVPVTRQKPTGETETVRAKVVDFQSAEKNEFLRVRELWVHGSLYRDYLDTVPQLFYHNAFIMFSNGLEARVGTIDSKWEFFSEWKRLAETDLFLSQKISRKFEGSPTIVILTDHDIIVMSDEAHRTQNGVFADNLMHLSHALTEEQKRYVREGFKSDEELALYELLVKDNLTKAEIKKLKLMSADLLDKIKSELQGMDHPFEKPSTKAAIIVTIRDIRKKPGSCVAEPGIVSSDQYLFTFAYETSFSQLLSWGHPPAL